MAKRHSDQRLVEMVPVEIDAEVGVLGSLMILPDIADDVSQEVSEDDFFEEANRLLFRAIMGLHAKTSKVDVTLLVAWLKERGEFEQVGGAANLYRVANSVPNAAHAKYYAKLVRLAAVRRRVILAANDILEDVYAKTHESAEDLVASAESRFGTIDLGKPPAQDIGDVMHAALAALEARSGGVGYGSVKTGLADLDAMTGGLWDGGLTILAGRPSMGKSALAGTIAANIAKAGKLVVFVSLEMSSIELADRMLAVEANVSAARMRAGVLSNDERHRIVTAAAEISRWPLSIYDSAVVRVSNVGSISRRCAKRKKMPLGLIVVDYLQLLEPDDRKNPRVEQVAAMSRGLKSLAKTANVPVLCLCQLNREADKTADQRPRLHNLRESGSIEQDADNVWFVHRPAYYSQNANPNQAFVIVAKQRQGPTGDVELHWHAPTMTFKSAAGERLEGEAPPPELFGDEPGPREGYYDSGF